MGRSLDEEVASLVSKLAAKGSSARNLGLRGTSQDNVGTSGPVLLFSGVARDPAFIRGISGGKASKDYLIAAPSQGLYYAIETFTVNKVKRYRVVAWQTDANAYGLSAALSSTKSATVVATLSSDSSVAGLESFTMRYLFGTDTKTVIASSTQVKAPAVLRGYYLKGASNVNEHLALSVRLDFKASKAANEASRTAEAERDRVINELLGKGYTLQP